MPSRRGLKISCGAAEISRSPITPKCTGATRNGSNLGVIRRNWNARNNPDGQYSSLPDSTPSAQTMERFGSRRIFRDVLRPEGHGAFPLHPVPNRKRRRCGQNHHLDRLGMKRDYVLNIRNWIQIALTGSIFFTGSPGKTGKQQPPWSAVK